MSTLDKKTSGSAYRKGDYTTISNKLVEKAKMLKDRLDKSIAINQTNETKTNAYLSEIYEHYAKMAIELKKQREIQLNTFQLLDNYLTESFKQGNLENMQEQTLGEQQSNLKKKISKIQNEIANFV